MKSKRRQSEAPAKGTNLDLGQIEELLNFMAQHGLEEFEYSRGDLRIRLRKPATNSLGLASRAFGAPEIVVANPFPATQDAATGAVAPRDAAVEAARAEEFHIVKSPIVGTYYEAPAPGSDPFVKVGDHVETGQVLCIVEAMKLMNEIEAEVGGEIMRVFVENGQPVEYGEPLFAIRPSRKK